jgi:hypothetical protein
MTLERRIGISTDGYRGGEGGVPTTVTVVVNGTVKNAGLAGTVKQSALTGVVSKRGLTGMVGQRGITGTIVDGLKGTVRDGSFNGELK